MDLFVWVFLETQKHEKVKKHGKTVMYYMKFGKQITYHFYPNFRARNSATVYCKI